MDVSNIECHNIDSSDYKYNLTTDNFELKDEDEKSNILGKNNINNICENLTNSAGAQKCKFVNYNKYIPDNLNSKYATIDMCLPIDKLDIPANIINKQSDCREEEGHYWSDDNKNVKIDNECNNIKYMNVCNYHDNCLWQKQILYK